jgi:hypothetical protein
MTPNNGISLGPWRFNRTYRLRDIPTDQDRECVEFVNATGMPIGCWVPYDWDGECPDSILIRAATDLLEACKDCADLLDFMHDSLGGHNCTVDCPDVGKRVDRARAAIAKAQGETA